MPLKKASELESKEIEDLNAKVTSLENKLNKLELQKFEKQILINKIPKHPFVKRHAKESSAETKEVVKDFLDSIEYKDYIPDCYRIPLSIKQASSKKEIYPVICCTFASKNDKKQMQINVIIVWELALQGFQFFKALNIDIYLLINE